MPDEVFHVGNGAPANFNNGSVKLSINGQLKKTYNAGSQTLGAFVDSQAKAAGIRTFSVYADGRKLTTADSNSPASSFKEIDLVAKDSRGLD
jgi:hypothetical protein